MCVRVCQEFFAGRACTEIDLNIFVHFIQVILWIEAEQHLLFAYFFQAFITNCRFLKKSLYIPFVVVVSVLFKNFGAPGQGLLLTIA